MRNYCRFGLGYHSLCAHPMLATFRVVFLLVSQAYEIACYCSPHLEKLGKWGLDNCELRSWESSSYCDNSVKASILQSRENHQINRGLTSLDFDGMGIQAKLHKTPQLFYGNRNRFNFLVGHQVLCGISWLENLIAGSRFPSFAPSYLWEKCVMLKVHFGTKVEQDQRGNITEPWG